MASPSRIGEDINPTHSLSNFLRSRYTIITASAKKIKKIANKSNGRNKLNISILCLLCPKMAYQQESDASCSSPQRSLRREFQVEPRTLNVGIYSKDHPS